MINLIGASNITDQSEWDLIDVINIISLKRFRDGGPAILQTRIRNHHIDRLGAITIIPLVKYEVRVCVILYEMFAKINIAEEQSPWAIIIIRAPVMPQLVIVITPLINSPM